MKLPFIKKSHKLKHKKDGRIDPHRFMIYFTSILFSIMTIEILIFSYFFALTSRKLDTEIASKPSVNTDQIRKIEDIIQKTEETVRSRQGIVPSSQNEDHIVQ